MEMAKVTSKGQITIPVSIRRRLNINEGDKLLFIDRPEGVMMVNPEMLPGGKAEEIERPAAPAAPTAPAAPPAEPAPVPPEPDADRQGAPQAQRNEPEKQGAPLQGLDLNSLLSEIRSIGSNI